MITYEDSFHTDVERIEASRVVVFYHKNCPDGCTAAWVVGMAHDEPCGQVPVMHCEMSPDDERVEACAGKVVYMVDTYQSGETLMRIEDVADRLIIMDHHVSGVGDCTGIREYIYSDHACGALIAWEALFPGPPPALVRYVNDMDLWKNELPNTKEIQMVLRDIRTPDDAGRLSQRMEFAVDMIVKSGAKKLARVNRSIKTALDTAKIGFIGGVEFVCHEGRRNRNDIGMALAKEFGKPACVWAWQGDKFTYSLRSVDPGVDAVAESFGGGGHPCASGFASDSQVIRKENGEVMESRTKMKHELDAESQKKGRRWEEQMKLKFSTSRLN